MTIAGVNADAFKTLLREHIRPSAPIDTFEHLVGRTRQREIIEEALTLPGRHIFTYGDRGAGKTSLALTAAYEHNPASGNPTFVACGSSTSFSSIVQDIVMQLMGRSRLNALETNFGLSASALGNSVSAGHKTVERPIDADDLNSIAGLLIEATNQRTGRTLVVVDEFENLPDVNDRRRFAELVKQLSDRQMP